MEVRSGRTNEGMNVLKFAALTLVIFIHETLPGTLGVIVKGVAAMAVPVFFMVSGYYSYGADIPDLKRRALKILKLVIAANILYFCWDIAVELLSGGSAVEWFRETCTVKSLLVFLLTNESPLRGHLWFLGALLYSYIFIIVFLKYLEKGRGKAAEKIKKSQEKFLVLLSLILLVLNIAGGEFLTLYGRNIQIPYIRNWLFMGLPFFILAYCLRGYWERTYRRFDVKRLWVFLAFALILNIAEVWLMPPSGLYITTSFVNILTFMTALSYEEVKNPLLCRLGRLADKYGLWVYVLQIIVIKNLRWFYAEWGIADMAVVQYLSPFIALALSFLLAVPVVWAGGGIGRKK